jgi:hypothetical protein
MAEDDALYTPACAPFRGAIACSRAPVAQGIEQRISTPRVGGSNPSGRANFSFRINALASPGPADQKSWLPTSATQTRGCALRKSEADDSCTGDHRGEEPLRAVSGLMTSALSALFDRQLVDHTSVTGGLAGDANGVS